MNQLLSPRFRAWTQPLLGLMLLTLAGCDLLEFSPNDHRVPEEFTRLTEKNVARLLAQPLAPEDTLRFIFTGDSQQFYDDAEDLVSSVNQQPGIKFLVLAGDISDFGLAREMRWIDTRLRELKVPYVTVIGNHDQVGNGRETYQHIYGPLNYSFVYGDTKFSFVDTNGREYNFDGQVPDMGWVRQQTSNLEGARRQVVICHVPPDNDDFDPVLRMPYVEALRAAPGLVFELNGHNHESKIWQPFGDGITYVNSDAFQERRYMVVTVWGDKQFRIKQVTF